jgi:PAS domain S-box-containing protein
MQKIHIKIISILALVSVIFIAGMFIFRNYEEKRLQKIYTETTEQYTKSFTNLLKTTDKTYINLVEKLYTLGSGISKYIDEPFESYEKSNLKILVNQYDYDYVIILDSAANIVFSFSNNGKSTDFEYLSNEQRLAYLQKSNTFHFYESMPKGILELRGATVHDTYDTSRSTKIEGYFFLGRYWNDAQISKLEEITQSKIEVLATNLAEFPEKKSDFEKGLITTQSALYNFKDETIGYLINTVQDNKIKKLLYYANFNLTFYVIFASVLFLLTFIFLFIWIYRPIKKISDGVKNTNVKSLEKLGTKKDEFGKLSQLLAESLYHKQNLIKEVNIRKESEEKFKALISQVPDYIIVHKDSKIVYVNEASCKKLGFSCTELINTNILQYIEKKDHAKVIENITRRSLGENVDDYEITLIGKNNQKIDVIVRASFIQFENEPAVLSVLIDVTQLKEAENALKKLLEEQRILLSLLPACVYFKNEKLEYISGNQCFIDTIDLESTEALRGLSDYDIFEEKNAIKSRESDLQIIKTGKGQYNIIDKRKGPDGKILYKSTTKVPYFDDDGKVIGIIGVTWDITEQKETELELIEAKEKAEEATREKQSFLSTMSHEIRTPLNAIIGSSNLLLQDNPREDQVENLKILEFSGNLLLSLINDILDFSKIEVGKIEFEYVDFNLQEFLDRIIKSFHFKLEEKKLDLKLEIDNEIPEIILGDQVRLNQILINLIGNSIKFTEKGNISVKLIIKEKKNNFICIGFKITDTGIGIPKNKLSDIFEPFKQADNDTTRKYGGSGLGLAITKKLIELQGGKISVESEVNKGTTFSFDLSFKVSDKKKSEKHLEIQHNEYFDLSGKHILLVEDNKINQSIAIKFIKNWKATYELAENGLESLDKIQNKNFDLILMDLQMPEMGGYEAVKNIRKMEEQYFKQIPIIALTASASLEVKNKVIEKGFNDYVSKPFNPYDLNNKIHKLLK